MSTYTFEWNFLHNSSLIKQFKFAKPNSVLCSDKFIYRNWRFCIECTPNGYQQENVPKGRCALWLAIDKTNPNGLLIDVTVTFSCNAINYYVATESTKMGSINSGYPWSLSSNTTSNFVEYVNLSNWTFRCNVKINATHVVNPHLSLPIYYNQQQYNNQECSAFTFDWHFVSDSPQLHQFKFAQQNAELQSDTFVYQKCGFFLECTPNGYVTNNVPPDKCLLWLAVANLPPDIEAIDVIFTFTCDAINYHTSRRCNKMGRDNSGFACSSASLVTSDLVDYLNLSHWTFRCTIKIIQQYTLRPQLSSTTFNMNGSNINTKSDSVNTSKLPEYMNALNSPKYHKEVDVLITIFEAILAILKNKNNKKYQNLSMKRISNKFKNYSITHVCMVILYQAGFEKSDDGKRLLYDTNNLHQLQSVHETLVSLRDKVSHNKEQLEEKDCHNKVAVTQKLPQDISTILKSNEIVNTIDSKHLLQISEITDHKSNNNESKCDLSSCNHLKQLVILLTKYHIFVREQIEQKNDSDSNEVYNLNQCGLSVLNDFHHLLSKHYDQFEDVYNLLKKTCNNKNVCTLSKCIMFKRNYRDRACGQSKRKQLNAMYFVTNELTIETQQILDKIHCFYIHSFDIGYKLTRKEKQYILNQRSE
eukprot:184347_1